MAAAKASTCSLSLSISFYIKTEVDLQTPPVLLAVMYISPTSKYCRSISALYRFLLNIIHIHCCLPNSSCTVAEEKAS